MINDLDNVLDNPEGRRPVSANKVVLSRPLKACCSAQSKAAVFIGCASTLLSMALIVLSALSCSNPASENKVSQLRFHNAMEITQLGGISEKFQVRNITALGETWNEEIGFGMYSSFQDIESRSTDFTVNGEIRSELGGVWTPTKWTKRIPVSTTSESTVELSFEE